MMATLKADLLNILKKLPIPFFLAITIVAIVLIMIIIHSIIKSRKKRGTTHRIKSDFGERSYRKEILNSLPEAEQLDFSNLYSRLDELQSFVSQGKRQLELQKSETVDSIDRKIQDSQNKIRNKWNYQKKKSNFYHCICVHYASFTLADSIKREQENIRDVYVRYKMECDQLSKQINYLSQQIESSNGRQKYEYMQQHKAIYKKRQRLSKLKNVFAARNAQYLKKVKEQNAYTKKCREYIISNFGAKGRAWGQRLERRKADLIASD